jgi:hypothetical protein
MVFQVWVAFLMVALEEGMKVCAENLVARYCNVVSAGFTASIISAKRNSLDETVWLKEASIPVERAAALPWPIPTKSIHRAECSAQPLVRIIETVASATVGNTRNVAPTLTMEMVCAYRERERVSA